jgi:thiamine-phosphate pyrophosphorylase
MKRGERLKKIEAIDIYPVTCQALSNGRSNLEVLDAVLTGGAKIIQLREKNWDKKDLYTLALEFRRRMAPFKAILIINDHVDVALAAGADGVHVGQQDLPVAAARKIAPDLIIGASSHNIEQAHTAEADGADYINIGPIFPTNTKKLSVPVLGPAAIAEIGPKLGVPFTIMGGITADNLKTVVAAGARRVAMVSAITGAADISGRIQKLRRIITG